MILIGQYDSPYVRRVAVSLHLLGLDFAREPLSTFRDVAAMQAINPTLRVPALVLDDGEVMTDSHAILDHLDDLAGPERALVPATGPERRRCRQLVGLACAASDKAVAILYERALRPPEKLHQPWLDRCRDQLEAALVALEAATGAGWLVGDWPTQADVTTVTMLGFVTSVVPDAVRPGMRAGLARLQDRAEALPAFVACRPDDSERLAGA